VSDHQQPKYPDVLGYITDVPPHTVGGVQVALALRPGVVRAGRHMEVIMLIQNTVDAPVDIAVELQAPEKDAAGKKGRFVAGKARLVVGVEAAEVGYVMLPVSTMPDTAVSEDYTLGMEIKVKQLKKGTTVRHPERNTSFQPDTIPTDRQEKVQELKQLQFSTRKRGLLRSNTLEIPFAVSPGKVGSLLDLKPGWVSLWTLQDHDDINVVLDKFREVLRDRVLPALKPEALFKPLAEKTAQRFQEAGYPLNETEVVFAVKMMLVLIEYARDTETRYNPLEVGIYHVGALLQPRPEHAADTSFSRELPRWLKAMLGAMARDERVIRYPQRALPFVAYDELLYDSLLHAFALVENVTGENLGTHEEMQRYAESVLQMLRQSNTMNFVYAYMPLILGGITIHDKVLLPNERLSDVLQELRIVLDHRENELTADNEMAFRIAQRIVDHSLKKYGYYD
jgi:hypothetical protein